MVGTYVKKPLRGGKRVYRGRGTLSRLERAHLVLTTKTRRPVSKLTPFPHFEEQIEVSDQTQAIKINFVTLKYSSVSSLKFIYGLTANKQEKCYRFLAQLFRLWSATISP